MTTAASDRAAPANRAAGTLASAPTDNVSAPLDAGTAAGATVAVSAGNRFSNTTTSYSGAGTSVR